MASAKPKKKNPRLASGRKRARQGVKLNAANTSLRSKYRTAVKNVEKAVVAGDTAYATETYRFRIAFKDAARAPVERQGVATSMLERTRSAACSM